MMIKKTDKALTIRIFVEVGYFMYKLPPTSPKYVEEEEEEKVSVSICKNN